MASSNVPETNAPIYNSVSTPERNERQDPYALDTEAADDTKSFKNGTEHEGSGQWEASIIAGCTSPLHLLAAVFVPGASAGYSARGINKFPVAIGIAVGLFFYATVAFIALTAIEGDDQPATTVGGMELKAWQSGAGWAIVNFLGITFMLRGWFRAFYNIPGNKLVDCGASFLCSCCTLAQMSKHTQVVSSKSTLPGYNV